MKFQRIKGTKDIWGEEFNRWNFLLNKGIEVIRKYGYSFIVTPTFEETNLFVRSVGAGTDIVEKEMYTFRDRGNRSLTLRPEGTAPVVRAIIENRISIPCKLAYYMNMFRQEKPQKGRFRELSQLGIENIGYEDYLVDMELFLLLRDLMTAFEIHEYSFLLNSMGCMNDRKKFKKELRNYTRGKLDRLCNDCKHRYDKNPLRILDCKIDGSKLKDHPRITDYLCPSCEEHFKGLLGSLEQYKIPYTLKPRMVRGLDYYTRTVFEVISKKLGAQDSLAGGGRYDGLFELLGGSPTPAAGFAIGFERILLASSYRISRTENPVFVVYTGDNLKQKAYQILHTLRENGLKIEMVLDKKSLKSQMRRANKISAPFVIIVGEDELKMGGVKIRDMETGEEFFTKEQEIFKKIYKWRK